MSKRPISPVSSEIAAAKIREQILHEDYGYSPQKAYAFSTLITKANFRFNLERNEFEFVENPEELERFFEGRSDISRSLIIECLQTINSIAQTRLRFYTRNDVCNARIADTRYLKATSPSSQPPLEPATIVLPSPLLKSDPVNIIQRMVFNAIITHAIELSRVGEGTRFEATAIPPKYQEHGSVQNIFVRDAFINYGDHIYYPNLELAKAAMMIQSKTFSREPNFAKSECNHALVNDFKKSAEGKDFSYAEIPFFMEGGEWVTGFDKEGKKIVLMSHSPYFYDSQKQWQFVAAPVLKDGNIVYIKDEKEYDEFVHQWFADNIKDAELVIIKRSKDASEKLTYHADLFCTVVGSTLVIHEPSVENFAGIEKSFSRVVKMDEDQLSNGVANFIEVGPNAILLTLPVSSDESKPFFGRDECIREFCTQMQASGYDVVIPPVGISAVGLGAPTNGVRCYTGVVKQVRGASALVSTSFGRDDHRL